MGAPALAASTLKPGGGSVMLSRWLIQHCSTPRMLSRMSPRSITLSVVLPNSLRPVRATVPPSSRAMPWAP